MIVMRAAKEAKENIVTTLAIAKNGMQLQCKSALNLHFGALQVWISEVQSCFVSIAMLQSKNCRVCKLELMRARNTSLHK